MYQLVFSLQIATIGLVVVFAILALIAVLIGLVGRCFQVAANHSNNRVKDVKVEPEARIPSNVVAAISAALAFYLEKHGGSTGNTRET